MCVCLASIDPTRLDSVGVLQEVVPPGADGGGGGGQLQEQELGGGADQEAHVLDHGPQERSPPAAPDLARARPTGLLVNKKKKKSERKEEEKKRRRKDEEKEKEDGWGCNVFHVTPAAFKIF